MTQDYFDPGILADMGRALDRACRNLPLGDDSRSYIAVRILETAQRGYKSLETLTDAGMIAVSELSGTRLNRHHF